MTEPSQYFKGRTVQEQMDEVIDYVDTRAAEVATTAIASDVAQVHQDMLDADADASAAAASAAAAAGTLANAVKKTGEASQSIAGDIAVSGNLTGGTVTVPTPVNNTDAANKKYVDDQDALKLNITDVNTVAVGLTGNQNNITGDKTFLSPIRGYIFPAGRIPPRASSGWLRLLSLPSGTDYFIGFRLIAGNGYAYGLIDTSSGVKVMTSGLWNASDIFVGKDTVNNKNVVFCKYLYSNEIVFTIDFIIQRFSNTMFTLESLGLNAQAYSVETTDPTTSGEFSSILPGTSY